jgi:hypothetical protein
MSARYSQGCAACSNAPVAPTRRPLRTQTRGVVQQRPPVAPHPQCPLAHKRGGCVQQRPPVASHPHPQCPPLAQTRSTTPARGLPPPAPLAQTWGCIQLRPPVAHPPAPPRTQTRGCVQLGLPATPPPTPLRTQVQPGCHMYPHAFLCEGHLRAYPSLYRTYDTVVKTLNRICLVRVSVRVWLWKTVPAVYP